MVTLLPMSAIESRGRRRDRLRDHRDHHAHHVVIDGLDQAGLGFEVVLHQPEGYPGIRGDRTE